MYCCFEQILPLQDLNTDFIMQYITDDSDTVCSSMSQKNVPTWSIVDNIWHTQSAHFGKWCPGFSDFISSRML